MIKLIKDEDLPQGSEEWLAMRRQFGTASEAASMLSLSPWIPKSPLQLWELKNGELTIKCNFAMQIGSDTEDEARESFQEFIGKIYEPICIADDESYGVPLMASLDGREIFSDGTSIVEIKVPLNGKTSPLWKTMESGDDLPLQYQLQMTQQMMLSHEEYCHFWVYDRFSHTGIYRKFEMDLGMKTQILDGWKEFFKGKPEAGPLDVVKRDDDAWLEVSTAFLATKKLLADTKKALETHRESVIDLCQGKSYKGNGLRARVNHDTGKWTFTEVK